MLAEGSPLSSHDVKHVPVPSVQLSSHRLLCCCAHRTARLGQQRCWPPAALPAHSMCVGSQPQITQIASRDSAGVGVGKGVGRRQAWQMCVQVAERLFPRWQPRKPVCVCGVAAALPSLAHRARNGHIPRLPPDEGG